MSTIKFKLIFTYVYVADSKETAKEKIKDYQGIDDGIEDDETDENVSALSNLANSLNLEESLNLEDSVNHEEESLYQVYCLDAEKFLDQKTCSICDTEFDSKIEGIEHVKLEHSDEIVANSLDQKSSFISANDEILDLSSEEEGIDRIDNESDHTYDDLLVGKKIRGHYETGWYIGKIEYFNTKLEEYNVSFEDGSSDYIKKSDIDGVEIILLEDKTTQTT